MRDGWEETNLGAFITQSKKKVKVLKGEVYPAVGVMMEGRGFVTREPFIGGKTTYKQLTPIEPNQLVLRSITAWEAPIQVTTDDHVGFHVSGVFPVFDIDSAKINPRFLGLHCQYNPFWESMRERTVGSVLRRKTLSAKALMEIPIELPPIHEQKRIVDLVSSVDSYIEALRQQLEGAKISRNAVLHELLNAGGDGWVETTLGQVAVLNPAEPALSSTDHFAPMDAVHVGKRWLQYTEERGDRSGARARAGDVLFARITPCLENGKVAQVQSELDRCGGSTEFIVVRGTERCLSDFLYFWCTLKVNRDRAAELMTGTTGRQRLSWKDLGSLSLWLPPLTEQERIVDLVSTVDSYIDALEGQINSSTSLRSGLLSDLLSGNHEIPASYDQLIGAT